MKHLLSKAKEKRSGEGQFSKIFLLTGLLILFVRGCPVYGIFSVPCPCCGVTRAWLSFLRGDIGLAFQYHALFPAIPLFALLYICKDKFSVFWVRIANMVLIVFAGAIFVYAVMRWSGFVVMP